VAVLCVSRKNTGKNTKKHRKATRKNTLLKAKKHTKGAGRIGECSYTFFKSEPHSHRPYSRNALDGNARTASAEPWRQCWKRRKALARKPGAFLKTPPRNVKELRPDRAIPPDDMARRNPAPETK
jgi:hypothetical protein